MQNTRVNSLPNYPIFISPYKKYSNSSTNQTHQKRGIWAIPHHSPTGTSPYPLHPLVNWLYRPYTICFNPVHYPVGRVTGYSTGYTTGLITVGLGISPSPNRTKQDAAGHGIARFNLGIASSMNNFSYALIAICIISTILTYIATRNWDLERCLSGYNCYYNHWIYGLIYGKLENRYDFRSEK